MENMAKPISNPNLMKAIGEMNANCTLETKAKVINEIVRSVFIAPVQITPEPVPTGDGKVRISKDATIQFNVIQNNAGRIFFPAFTDWQELWKWRKDPKQQVFAVALDDYVRMLEKDDCKACGFVINPFSSNVPVTKEMALAIKKERDDLAARQAKGE